MYVCMYYIYIRILFIYLSIYLFIYLFMYKYLYTYQKFREKLVLKKNSLQKASSKRSVERNVIKGEVLERFAQGEHSNMMRGAVPRKRRMEKCGAQQKSWSKVLRKSSKHCKRCTNVANPGGIDRSAHQYQVTRNSGSIGYDRLRTFVKFTGVSDGMPCLR